MEFFQRTVSDILHHPQKPGFLRISKAETVNLSFRNPVSLALLRMVQDLRYAKQVVLNENPKNILIGGGRMTKTLQVARSFHAAGHRVILFDLEQYWFSGYRFSNSVAGFYTVPDSHEDISAYTQAVRAIAKKENIDFFVPVGIFAASMLNFALASL